ncbi:hypothetical protein C1645_820164 [Glomus cerebriforme]|uniref:Uncharacterized protein n=1 Tax=Glomus cerebriforme TaxID=658196 RepID=A0A397TCR8_9GLOM|nr:hypothetical protein C1645_820164 [Glomus cerebriforme]
MTEFQQSTLYLTPLMTEIAESSSSNSETKNARSQYVHYDSSSHESTSCSTRSIIMIPNIMPNKPIVNQAHENLNNNHDNEEHAFTLDRDDIPEEKLEDDLLQEIPGAIVDCKLIINSVCIRTVEKLLTLSPNATQLTSASAFTSASSDQDTVQDGQADENSAKRLREAIKMEHTKLRTDDLNLEISVLEVLGSPTCLNHTHYVGDKNKIAKMLKIILNYIKIHYSGCYEDFRKIKVYGIQIYVLLSDNDIFALQGVAKVRIKSVDDDIIISSTKQIYTYVTNIISESNDDDSKIDKVKTSPSGKKKNNRIKTSERE